MTGSRRTDGEIRAEIASERRQLVDAVADLRGAIDEKRRPAAVVVGAVATGLVAVAALRVLRRVTGT